MRNNLKVYSEIIKNILGNKCNNCKNRRDLHIHHKDGNYTNNKLNNIELLCKGCHSEFHKKEKREIANTRVSSRFTGGIALNCKYCGKEITSLYPVQLKQNVKIHELHCINKHKKEKKNGK